MVPKDIEDLLIAILLPKPFGTKSSNVANTTWIIFILEQNQEQFM